jgi:hypothetical protein
LQLFYRVITDTDIPSQAFFMSPDQPVPQLLAYPAGWRPMQQHQIGVTKTQFSQIILSCLISVVGFLYLSNQVERRSLKTAALEALTNARLGPVITLSYNHCISQFQGLLDSAGRVFF